MPSKLMNLMEALKREYTEPEEKEIGEMIAAIFQMKKNRKTGRYMSGSYYGDKTPAGLCRTFRSMSAHIDNGDVAWLRKILGS